MLRRLDGKNRQRAIAQAAPDASEEGPLSLETYLLCNYQRPSSSLGIFLWGSSIEPQLMDGGVWAAWGRLPRLIAGLACTCTVGVPVTLLSLVHPRPPVSNLVGKDLFLGPCNLAMGSHDQWQLQAEYTVGSWLLAGGVGQTVGE